MIYIPRHPRWDHQERAIRAADRRPFFAFLMAMRTGKTKTTLDEFGELQAEGLADDLLVVAPAGVYMTWIDAMREHLGEPLASAIEVFVWDARRASTSKLERERIARFLAVRDRPRAFVVNLEALSPRKIKGVQSENTLFIQRAVEEFLSARRSYFALDESTGIKDPDAKRSKYVVNTLARRANYRRILTGLLTPQGPLDAFMQFEFLQPGCLGFGSFYSFRYRYAVLQPEYFGKRRIDRVVGYRDVDDLGQRIRPHSFRVRLEDVYELPPKIYQMRHVSLTAEQERVYREIREYACARLANEAHVSAPMAMTQLLRLHQVLCGHVVDEEGRVHDIPSRRVDELMAVLEQAEGKAIIWCSYDRDIRAVTEAIRARYGFHSVARFWGGNIETREAEEHLFKQDPEYRFMVATASAGGRGRTWSVADLVVYYSNTPSLEHRAQSEERPQGVDKARSVLYVDLVAPGTVDGKILRALREKIDLASEIQGDGWREWIV